MSTARAEHEAGTELDEPHSEDFTHARSLPLEPDWFKRAVFYEVLVRAFFDSTRDGTGDLAA
jgi:maltose alpha-D-glucosyltransferase/alpha-amylase